jgi:23S rRNA (uracil1939-C5)-methyltransferase
VELTIEKLVYGGDGLARLPEDERGRGKTVFLPYVIPEERVDATITESRPGFARAHLNQILTSSAHRVTPLCQYFGRCGGCQYQHIDYLPQLQFKSEILRETLRRTAKLELDQEIHLHPSPPSNYRNRTRMQLQHRPSFALGYLGGNSHQVLPVEECPISSALINQAISAVWKLGREGAVPPDAHSLQFFANHDETTMLVELYVRSNAAESNCSEFAAVLTSNVPAMRGVIVTDTPGTEGGVDAPVSNFVSSKTVAAGFDHLIYHAAGHDYRVSGGSFFQTNRFLVDELARVATLDATGTTALDLYAGVGLFTVPLARSFQKVVAVEASPPAIADLKQNAPANVQAVRTTTEAFLAKQAAAAKPDFVLLDPPRAGLGEKATAALGRTSASRVTYVSCDPATLSRDLRLLLESGFEVQQAHLVDLFPQTAHMETVLHLAR